MSWVKLDDQARHHRKILAAGPTAAWLWVCGLMYCNSQKARDGIIPSIAVPVLYPITSWKREATKLVDAGLWEPVDGGYRIHDYHDYQPTPEQAAETSEAKAAAGRLGGLRSAEARRRKTQADGQAALKHGASTAEANAKQSASLLPKPVPSRPVPTPEDPPVAPQGGAQVGCGDSGAWRVPKSETRLARDEWIRAYSTAVQQESGDVGWSFRPQTFGTLERVVSSRCPPGRRANIAMWLEESVGEFVRSTKDSPQHWSAFSADGLERWWNAGRPGLAEAPRKLPPLPPEPAGEPLSAEEQAEIDAILGRHRRTA